MIIYSYNKNKTSEMTKQKNEKNDIIKNIYYTITSYEDLIII
jgi:hypothetical protein